MNTGWEKDAGQHDLAPRIPCDKSSRAWRLPCVLSGRILEWLHQPHAFGSHMGSPIPKHSLSWLLCVTRKGHMTQRKFCFTDNRGKCWRRDPSSSLPKDGMIPGTVAACLRQPSHYLESSLGDFGRLRRLPGKETHHQLLPSSLQVKSPLVRFCILQILPNNTKHLRKDFMACNSGRDKAKQNEIYKLIKEGRLN